MKSGLAEYKLFPMYIRYYR